jgi:hypothetical protein
MLNDGKVPNEGNTDKKIAISTSIEIYDSDNMVASKCLEFFVNFIKGHGGFPIIVHSAQLALDIPFNNKLMAIARNITPQGKEWVKQCLQKRNAYDLKYGAIASTLTDDNVDTVIDTLNAGNPTYNNPVNMLGPGAPAFAALTPIIGFVPYAGCKDATHRTAVYHSQDQKFIGSLHPNGYVIPGGKYNKPDRLQCKFSEDAYCVIHSFFSKTQLGTKGDYATVKAHIDTMLREPVNGPTRNANITSWV